MFGLIRKKNLKKYLDDSMKKYLQEEYEKGRADQKAEDDIKLKEKDENHFDAMALKDKIHELELDRVITDANEIKRQNRRFEKRNTDVAGAEAQLRMILQTTNVKLKHLENTLARDIANVKQIEDHFDHRLLKKLRIETEENK